MGVRMFGQPGRLYKALREEYRPSIRYDCARTRAAQDGPVRRSAPWPRLPGLKRPGTSQPGATPELSPPPFLTAKYVFFVSESMAEGSRVFESRP